MVSKAKPEMEMGFMVNDSSARCQIKLFYKCEILLELNSARMRKVVKHGEIVGMAIKIHELVIYETTEEARKLRISSKLG